MSDSDSDIQLGTLEYEHEVLVDSVESITPVSIECPGCGHQYREMLSPKLGGSTCPECNDLLRYVRREEYRHRQRDDLDQQESKQTALVAAADGGNSRSLDTGTEHSEGQR